MSNRWFSVVPSDAEAGEAASERRRSKASVYAPPRARSAEPPELSFADFRRYFPHSPTALAIKECARLSVMRRYPCPGPVLDVGCGDGLFAHMAFGDAEVWGIDIDAAEGRWAAASQAYTQIILGDVTRATLPEAFFASSVANCSLEHVPRIDLALRTIHDCLRPGGLAYLFVPNVAWASHLKSARVLKALGAPAFARQIQTSIDRLFRHHHLYDARGWGRIVEGAGFELIAVEPVLSSATTAAFEAFLLPSLAGLLNKQLTTRWTNFPNARRALAWPVYRAVKAIMDRADDTPTAEFFVVARRREA